MNRKKGRHRSTADERLKIAALILAIVREIIALIRELID